MPASDPSELDDNKFECARCGAQVYYELTRCPNCGVNLYEPEADEPGNETSPRVSGRDSPGLMAKLRRFFRRLFGERHPAEELFGAALEEQALLYHELLLKVGGEAATMERLIQYESRLEPGGNRTRWIKNAIKRWEKDNPSK